MQMGFEAISENKEDEFNTTRLTEIESDINCGSKSRPDNKPITALESSVQAFGSSLRPLELPEATDQLNLPPAPPSLRGKLKSDGNSCSCRGVWAISDAFHDQPGQTSEFEYKLIEPTNGDRTYPISGKYKGWFGLKNGLKTIKIEEKDLILIFAKDDSSDKYHVHGNGTNKFGSFLLNGHLSADASIQLYKEYQYKPLPVPKIKHSPHNSSIENMKKEDTPTPRETSGRVRKVSTMIQGFEDPSLKPLSPRSQVNKATTPVSLPSPKLELIPTTPSARDRRLSIQMHKCLDLLKEISKLPQSIWFLEPVDHIKLNIPDYPLIITQPMDFGSIRDNLENSRYDSMDVFVEHMRLVFRNAIAYNQLRDNPVHIAAREINSKFEEKLRLMIAQLGQQNANNPDDYSPRSGGRQSFGGTTKRPGFGRAGPNVRKPVTPGVRPQDVFVPASLDPDALSIVEMHRKMQEMSQELVALRTQIRHTEIKSTIESQRDAARNPLTLQEKQLLIQQIQQLPEPKMNQAIEIIRAALPPESRASDGNDGEIEISLDELSTLTLRKLQNFVDDYFSKKRPFTSAPSKASNGRGGKPSDSGKKARKSNEFLPSSNSEDMPVHSSNDRIPRDLGSSPGPMDEEDSLLFSNDDLEGGEPEGDSNDSLDPNDQIKHEQERNSEHTHSNSNPVPVSVPLAPASPLRWDGETEGLGATLDVFPFSQEVKEREEVREMGSLWGEAARELQEKRRKQEEREKHQFDESKSSTRLLSHSNHSSNITRSTPPNSSLNLQGIGESLDASTLSLPSRPSVVEDPEAKRRRELEKMAALEQTVYLENTEDDWNTI